MLDPIGPPPAALARLVQPVATRLNLTTLPLHIHEVLFFVAFYQFVLVVVSPALSSYMVPKQYHAFNRRTRLNWDIHVVSLFQSACVNTFALYAMYADRERASMGWQERVWGYSGAGGLMQAMALGYFVWDLYVCTRYVSLFGVGMLAHAMSAVTVFGLGFRPFVNYYCPVFILYELSSPFLNFHWFFDKLNMTGSRPQLYNGILLIISFFGCRLVWGSYQSYSVFSDIYKAMQSPPTVTSNYTQHIAAAAAVGADATIEASTNPQAEIMRFAGSEAIPLWLASAYLASNIVLNTLNWYWFNKMVAAVRKRFTGPKEKTKMEVDSDGRGISEHKLRSEVVNGGAQILEADKVELRRRN